MHGNAAGEGRKKQEHIEQTGEYVLQYGHTAKCLLEHVWQGDEDKSGTGIGTDSHAEHGREYDETGRNGNQRVYGAYTNGRGE